MQLQLQRIKHQVSCVQNLWWKTSFGQEGHQWMMGECLTKESLGTFEATHSVRLPDEYRAFLLEVGNGGLGPGYGILPLASWHEVFDEDELTGDLLSGENPLREGLTGQDWLEQLGGRDCWQRIEAATWHPYQGAIALCHHGCSSYTVLIATGPRRGRVCNVSLDFLPPSFSPYPTFFPWYEGWLNRLLSQKWLDRLLGRDDLCWFGYP